MISSDFSALPDSPPPPANVLIVDDTPDNLRLLANLLSERQYRVRTAVDGPLALRSAQLSPPDLILLDIMMPGMDGFEVCRKLQEDELTREIPIIFLTAKDEEQDKIKAFQLGGSDYITKPFQVGEVLARVERHLELRYLQQQLQERNQQLQAQNQQLQQEVRDRIAAETALQASKQDLEDKVKSRTIALHQALQREKEMSGFKSSILDAISHEFRTPLTVIDNLTSLLEIAYGRLNADKVANYCQEIHTSVQRIVQLLDNVLLLSKAKSGQLEFHPRPTNLAQLCQSVVEQASSGGSNGHPIQFSSGDRLDRLVSVDADLLTTALNHVLSNALCYSPSGQSILVELEYTPREVSIYVRDSGIGIPAHEQDRVFEQFFQASNAHSIAGTPGVGLGLAIVKTIVEAHQGWVSLVSHEGVGTTVAINLPLHPPESRAA